MSKDHLENPRDDYERNYREVQEERHYEGHPPRHSQEHYTPETPQDPYRDTDMRMERRAQYEGKLCMHVSHNKIAEVHYSHFVYLFLGL
jgi:hypothetical protein